MDEALLLWINQGWAHPALDVFFEWISQRQTFALPLGLLLLALFAWRLRRQGLWLWLTLGLAVGTGDAFGNLLKHTLQQPRPCFELADTVRQPHKPPGTPCGDSLSGMPSNHSLNYFAAAAFLTAVLGWRAAALLLLATLVALSRVYLGKHYPSQIAVGAMIGTAWGLLWAYAAVKWLPFMRQWRREQAPNHESN